MNRPSEPTVWVLVHDLGRTGAPTVLERLLRARSQSETVHLVAIRGGPLRRRIAPLVRTCTVLEPDHRRSFAEAVSVGAHELGAPPVADLVRRAAWFARLRRLPGPDVVLVHGAGAWPVVSAVRGRPPVVLHLHELALGLDRAIPPAAQAGAFARSTRVLGVSRAVADLVVRRGADPGRVEVLPGVVEVDAAIGVAPGGLGADAGRAVMGAGTPGWRKATDRVAAVAHELGRHGHPAAVGWVGGMPDGADTRWVSGPDPVHWYAEMDDPWTVMSDAQVVLVPSREDPLPLVALEAGLHSKAVVATPSGGLVDLLAEGRGALAPAHDVAWLSDRTLRLLENAGERSDLGAALHDLVVEQHDSRVVAPTWWSILRDAAG